MKHKGLFIVAIGLFFLLGCKQPSETVLSPTSTPEATEAVANTTTPEPTVTPEPTITPTETPPLSEDKVPEMEEGLQLISNHELYDEVYCYLGLNPSEWFGKMLKKTAKEAVVLLYPPAAQVTQTDCYADISMKPAQCIYLVSVRPDGEAYSFTSVNEYGVSQVGVYEKDTSTFFGIVLRDRNDSVGLDNYGMIWYRLEEAGVCQRVCSVFELNDLYDYWEQRIAELSTDGIIRHSHPEYGETVLNADIFLSLMYSYESEYDVSGPELIRKVIREDEKRDALYFDVGYDGAEVVHYVQEGDAVYFVIKKYSGSHQAGFESAVIGAMDLSGNIFQCESYSADRMNADYLKTKKNDYLVLFTETEYQGLVSSETQVFRTDKTGFVRTWGRKKENDAVEVTDYAVYEIDYDAVEQIPITEEAFTHEAFRDYIREHIDTDRDGYLTKKEREQVTEIKFHAGEYQKESEDESDGKKAALDGLNWFPNLERLELLSEAEVYLYNHPGITFVNWKESGASLVYAENCDKLEQIDVYRMSSGGAIYARNCKELKQILNYDGKVSAIYTFETPNCAVLNEESPFPTKMPESKVKVADPEAERIPITEEYFSGRYFRSYIREHVDTDKDGFLTRQEREHVTEVDLDLGADSKLLEDINVVDGLNWFPNMEFIGHMDGRVFEIYLDHHPGVKHLGSAEVWDEATYFIDGCDELESIWFCTNGDMALFVNDCKNLTSIDGYEYDFSSLYVSECPNLRIYREGSVSFPNEWYLDDDAQVVWAGFNFDEFHYIDWTRFYISEDGFPYWKDEWGAVEGTEQIHWLGFEQETPEFSEQIEQMLSMQEAGVAKELLENDEVQTDLWMILFSPRKPSIYYAETEKKEEEQWTSLAKTYYVVEGNGTITAYDSLEELCTAAKEIEGIEDISEVLK